MAAMDPVNANSLDFAQPQVRSITNIKQRPRGAERANQYLSGVINTTDSLIDSTPQKKTHGFYAQKLSTQLINQSGSLQKPQAMTATGFYGQQLRKHISSSMEPQGHDL